MTRVNAGSLWRRRRALVMAAAARTGASVRFLADVFDLSPGHASRVVASVRRESERAGIAPSRDVFADWLGSELAKAQRARRSRVSRPV